MESKAIDKGIKSGMTKVIDKKKSSILKNTAKHWKKFSDGFLRAGNITTIRHRLTKLVVSVVLPLIIISILILIFLYIQMRKNINRQIATQSTNVFRQYQDYNRGLKIAVKLISQTPEIVSGTEIGKINLVVETLSIFSREMKIPFTAVHDKDGFALGKGHKLAERFQNDSSEEYVMQGLKNKKNFELITNTSEGLAVLSIAPIYSTSSTERFSIAGIATAGYLVNNDFARMLKGNGDFEILFIHRQKVIGSSINFSSENFDISGLFPQLTLHDSNNSLKIEGLRYATRIIPLGKSTANDHLYILIAINSTSEISSLQITVFIVALLLFVSIVLSFILSFKMSRKITLPVYDLVETSKLITEGNYVVRSQVKSNDEMELLSNAFNMMIEKLQRNIENLDFQVEKRTRELKKAYEIIKEDLSMAKKVQVNFITARQKKFPDINICTFFQPMIEVGGDIYDFFDLKTGHYRIFIADATGHGVQAALTTMIIKSEYDKIKIFDLPPNLILKILNNTFIEGYYNLNVFFTCVIADIDTEKNVITYSSAGHPVQYLISGNKVQTIQAKGRMIGILDYTEYELFTAEFKKNDKLLLFTDGIYEEFKEYSEELGEEGFRNIINKYKRLPINQLMEKSVLTVKNWLGNNPVNDDITIVGVEME